MTKLRNCPYPIEQLLPQAPPMILIDEIVGWNDDQVVAAVTVRRDAIFAEDRGMPAHVALEWMAQTCGALVGIKAIESREPVRVGFLLGTRDFRSRISWFNLADRVTVTATSTFSDGEMAVFDCQVDRLSKICVTARLTLYQPQDLKAMLLSQGLSSADG
jgi:predicted hotdog family 3-hydroxylacyl-ACP dehydratase